MKKLLLTLTLILITASLPTLAYDFESDNLYYNILSPEDQTCEVTRGSTKYSGDIIIPSTVTYNETTYTITAIGNRAFQECFNLTSIDIPNSVTTIGKTAFYWCENLTSIDIPNSVTTIGEHAFRNCSSLTSINIPNSVTTIGTNPFYNCKNLKSFTGKFASDDNRCLIIDGVLNSFAPAELTTYTIPNSVTTIGKYAFNACTNLTSIDLPNTITTIEIEAFAYCSNLTSINIPNSVTTIGMSAFFKCTNLTSISIPNSVTTIGNWAFDYCSKLTTIDLPYSVTTIGNNPFSNCSNLKSFIGKFASDDNRCLIVDGVLNSFAPAELTTYTIPNSVTTIGKTAFYWCENLTSINIPNSVTTIGDYAFQYCSNLTSINIPNSVTTIGESVFWNCSHLTSIVIPNSVTTIGYGAFYNCSNLIEIISLAVTPPSVEKYTFYDVPTSTCTLKVPAESIEAYKSAEVWKDFLNIVPLTEEELQALPVERISATPILPTPTYNLRGQQVGTTYKGIVVRNRHKVILK